MSSLFDNKFNNKPRVIKTDNGDRISIVKFPISKVYQDPESVELSRKYYVDSHPGFVQKSLGSANVESFAGDLFRFYSAIGEFCGIPRKQLEKLDDPRTERLEEYEYLRSRMIEER